MTPLEPADRPTLARLESILDRFDTLSVLVLGDLLLDEYRIGDVERISPEAPVPIVRVRETRWALGGAGNVARCVVALGARCRIIAVTGEDPEADRLLVLLRESGLSAEDIVQLPGRATSHKLRVVGHGQQMLRLDREEEADLSLERLDLLRDRIELALPDTHMMILQDYGKGLLSQDFAGWTIRQAKGQGVAVAVDPKRDLARFRGADLVKPNLAEALAAVPGAAADFESRRSLLEKIQRALGGAEVVLTRGAEGMSALDRAGAATDLATRPVEVFDVQGAGDTSIAALSLCRAAGASLVEACIVANAAAAIVVGKQGTATLDRNELRSALPAALANFEETA